VLDGEAYTSVEAAYVAAKTTDIKIRHAVQKLATPGTAKQFGRAIPLREDWELVKIDIMLNLLRQKFKVGTTPAELLAHTAMEELVEGNHWGDTFWGVCNGKGENNLGKLLMLVRAENKLEMLK